MVFLENSQNLKENTCASLFFNKVAANKEFNAICCYKILRISVKFVKFTKFYTWNI